jgi:hypothetical protein
MLKKLFSIAALTSLLVGGLSATQANAEAPNVDIANVESPSTEFTIDLASTSEVVIPAGLDRFILTPDYQFAESFLIAQQGRTLGASFSINLPNGTPISKSQGFSTQPTYFNSLRNGSLFNNTTFENVQANYGNQTIAVPADATGYSGELRPSFYVEAADGQTLPAGTYTFTANLTTLSGAEVVPSDAAGLTVSPIELTYSASGATFTTPASFNDATSRAVLCVDTTMIAVGDELTAQILVDGVARIGGSTFWSTKTNYKTYEDVGYRGQDWGAPLTVTQFDVDWGLFANVNMYQGDLEPSTTYELSFKLFNAGGIDVSTNCAPAKPAAPTVSFMNGMLNVSGQFALGSSVSYQAECVAFDAAAPTVAVTRNTVSYNWQNRSNYTCSIFGLSSGKTYLIKFRDKFREIFSEYSDAAEVVIPAAGYTVTSTYPGVVEATKIVSVSNNVLPIEDYGTRTSVTPDGNGGFFMVGAKQGTCMPNCGTGGVRIRHATPTALDSTFAGTGSVVLESFDVTNAFASGFGYYGANKDKWALPLNGWNQSTQSGETQIVLGSMTSAATTSKKFTQSDVAPVCANAQAGYSTRPSSNMDISVLGAPTNQVLLAITCYKSYTVNGMSAPLPLPILATMDPATGSLTFKAAMGIPSAEVNSVSTRYSVNPNATAGQAVVTAFSTSSLVTQINNFPQTNGGTIADHAVIRFDSSFNVLSTTNSAWATSGGQISSDPTMSIPGENTGKIFTIVNSGGVPSVVTFEGAAAGVVLAVDTAASEIETPSVATIAGHAVPSNETVLPVQVTAIGKEAAGWIDLTTGVLTTGEVLTYTTATGNGLAKFWIRGTDKNSYFVYSDSAAAQNLTVLKWIDLRYVAPVGPVPAVTSKDVKYSKNTPTAGAKVTLTGTELDEVISAKIGENAATLGTKTATSLQLTIPTATAAGTVDITLTTATGDTVVDTFTYVGAGVAQTVTVAALAASVTVGNADLVLSATVEFSPVDAGTAGAITWSSETPTVCSIVANKARLLTAGTCTVKATAAASGVLLAGTGTQSTTVSAAPAAAQTVTLTGPTKVVVDLDGFDVVSSATSGLKVAFSTTTPTICTVSSAGRVVAIAVGTCVITSTQSGNASWLSASKTLTITVAKTPTTPLTEKGDIKKPLALSKTGSFLKNGDTQLGWNRSKGTLAVKLSVVYIGPVKASISFKVGSKTYTCSTKFGLLKKQSSSKLLTITSPNLCSGKTEKTQLAALKKITTSTVVTVTIVRDMYFPTTYKKIRTKTRILYAKLG